MKALLKKIIPAFILAWYHKALALFAAFVYGNPSERMIVIGVTGTNGKSTTVNLLARVLETNGNKVGLASTVNFKVADREWLNDKKMTMLGRMQLQKLLRQMVDAGCRYAVIETSSQGIEQSRHLGVNYDYAVFTNLTPEHLEAHGGFENYKKAKGKLFEHLMAKPVKKLAVGYELRATRNVVEKIAVINADDPHADYFASFPADKKLFFSTKKDGPDFLRANEVSVTVRGTSFTINDERINLQLLGAFNVDNALAAIAVGLNEGLSLAQIKNALEKVALVPGRMEIINEGQNFSVLVDYAPEPASFAKLYETIKIFRANQELPINRIIHVFGSCGGGRDRARRPVLGKMAGEQADVCIVTNEDPYDDDPLQIIDEVAAGCLSAGKILEKDLFKILDRRAAIEKAIALAQADDLILITGKGAEQAMAVANGKYLAWDDRTVAREAIEKIKS